MSVASEERPLLQQPPTSTTQLWKLPIKDRPPHGSLFSRLFALPTFLLGCITILTVQTWFYPAWVLMKVFGERSWFGSVFEWGVGRTKQMFGMLLIIVFTTFCPTSITISTPSDTHTTLPLSTLIALDPTTNRPIGLNLPKNLVVMANHQAYLDWMVVWIMGYLSVTPADEKEKSAGWKDKGHGSRSIIILLKKQLKHLPIVGWGMQFYRFIFLSRSWASDQRNLTLALSDLSTRAKRRPQDGLWLTIFPEGTITSDEERAKSERFSKREKMPDFTNVLQPRSTGLQFCLKTLLPQMPDLKVLDLTIGYPGVPRAGYAQEWYGLKSVFLMAVSPPTIHVHVRLIDPLTELIPGVSSPTVSPQLSRGGDKTEHPTGLATEEEARAFGDWLRNRWKDKEVLIDGFVGSEWTGFGEPSSRSSLQLWGEKEQDERKRKEELKAEGKVELAVRL